MLYFVGLCLIGQRLKLPDMPLDRWVPYVNVKTAP